MTAPGEHGALFADFAEPVLRMTEGGRRAEKQRALEVAVTVWNAVVLEDAGVQPGAVDAVFAALARLRDEERAMVQAVVETLVARKRSAFAQTRWMVSRCELRAEGRLFVEARAVPAPPLH